MSDYLTNLVLRSFSPMAAVQPMVAPHSMAPELFEGFNEESSDSFAEPASSGDADSAEAEGATPQRNPSRNKPPRLEGPIGETAIRSDQASAPPFVNSQTNTIAPLRRASPHSAESSASRGQSSPPLEDDSPARPDEQTGKRATLKSPIASASSTSLEKPPAPIEKTPGIGTVLVNPRLQPLQGEGKAELSAGLSETTPFAESLPAKNINRSTRVAGNASAYIHGESMDAGVSTWHLMKKSGNVSSLSPRASLANLTQPVSAAVEKLQPPDAAEGVVDPTAAGPETRAYLAHLVPKVSAQSLLPIAVKRFPSFASRQASFETAAQRPLTETIINVAIGRIEIRATPFESPKRERQSNGPKVMNLDDYMQQRSRGNR